jgi:flagellar capping protein FliD
LALIQTHDAKVNYEPANGLGSEVVENGGQFYKFTHGDGKLAKHAFGASGLSAANATGMAAGERALDNVAGKAFSAKALLGTINARVLNTNYAQNALIESGGDFFKAKLTNLAEATFTLAGGISDLSIVDNNDHLMDIGNDRVFSAQMALKDTINHQADASYDPSGTLNDKLRTVGGLAGAFYKPLQVINFNNSFIDVSSYATSTSIVKDAGQYYQFSEAYAGRGGVATANPGEWVKSPTDNVFYQNTSGGSLSTDPGLVGVGVGTGWTSSPGNQTTLAGMVTQNEMVTNVTTFATDPSAGGNTLWTDVSNDVTKPTAGGNNYWTHQTDATTPGANQPGNAYWEKITDDVTNPVFGVANDFWDDEPLATNLTDPTFWTEVTNDVIKPTAVTDYWSDATAAVANFGDTNYWTNVTDAVSLDNQTLAGGDTTFCQDITDELVDFPAGPLISTYWDDITSDISLSTPPPAGGSNAYWNDATADLTDKSDPDFFGTWWTNATAEVTDESNGGFSSWWDDVDSDLTDLTKVGGVADLTDNYWTDITTEITDPNDAKFGNYWTEYAHLDGTTADPVGTATASGYDPRYWQMIDPGMKRLVNNGSDDVVATNAVDHTIWAKAGNLAASAGDDGSFGTHDANEDALKPATAVGTWTGLGTYGVGDLAKGSDGKYYQARIASNSGSPSDPTSAAGHDSWNLVGDNTKNDSFAYAFQYADTKFWEQVNLPEPGAGANWDDYWETLSETVLASSQPLGSVDLTDKIATANFDGFDGSNFPAGLGSFFIGDGTGAVRIDYDTANDSVSDLIARVNASEANVTMFYDPVGDRFVVQNNADGAIGINLHEDPDWDTLSANKGSGNILELMGLASPQDTSKYSAYSDANGYSLGDLVKTTVGGSTTYWQATGTIAALAGETPDIASSNWEQIGLGAGRAMTQELGNNYAIRINDGELVYNNTASFDETVHGYKGIDVNVGKGNVGDSGTFKVEHDITPVQNAVSKLVEEFNDAQDYLTSVVSVTQDGDNVTAGTFSNNIEISQLGSQLRKLVFGGSYAHSESGIADDGTSITVDTKAILDALDDPTELNLGAADAGYQVKVKADETKGGIVNYYEWDGSAWGEYSPQFTSFRLEDIGLDFGTGSNRVQVKDSSKLAQELNANLEKVKALFAEATATADDKNTGKSNRQYQGITYDLNDFLQNFLSGDSQTGYKGAYKAHIDSLRAQNKRIDDRVEDLDRYLEQREETLSAGFIRMEEMQSKLNTQLQTLTNSFAKKS